MKQPTTPFSFKKNPDIHALPEAVPSTPAPTATPRKTGKLKAHQVSCYLTEEEFSLLLKKLDGRPIAAVVRNLVLKYIDS